MKKFISESSGKVEIYLLLLLIVAAVALVGGFPKAGEKVDYLSPDPGIQGLPQQATDISSHTDLQLKYPPFITLSPTLPPQTCTADNGTKLAPSGASVNQITCSCQGVFYGWIIDCENGQGTCIDSPKAENTCSQLDQDAPASGYSSTASYLNGICTRGGYNRTNGQHFNITSNGFYCIDKPVIYLYPQVDTLVNVQLTLPGTLTVSIPSIPSVSPTGWNNVLAHPDGSLVYQGKHYHELYYESSVTASLPSSYTGILIPTRYLKQQLRTITTKLGLLPSEQQEFLEYWLPKLQALNSNYIFVSLLSPQEKDTVDKVTITPKPDTLLEYLFTFQPVSTPFAFEPLKLPHTPPQRTGFTAVEWGGTIDLK